MKKLIIGLVAVVASFGIGMAVPNVMAADVKVDDYEKAMAIIEGNYTASQIPETDTNETADAIPDDPSIDDSEASTEAFAAEISDAADVQTEDAASGDGAPNRDDVEIDEDTVILDWDYRDWAIAGVKLSESDYDKVLENLGVDNTTVTYSDGGFEIDWEERQWKDKKIRVDAVYANGNESSALYWDGSKYVTEQLEEMKPTQKSLCISGSWSDKENWTDYWDLVYTVMSDDFEAYKSGDSPEYEIRDYLSIYKSPDSDSPGIDAKDMQEISEILDLPFTGGGYKDMDAVFHTDEMIKKGIKDLGNSSDDYEVYIVKTNLGNCSFSISTYDGGSGTEHTYIYAFENYKYQFNISLHEDLDVTTDIYVEFEHPVIRPSGQ
ncbi:MAG: hypothetical protein K5673_08750 [Lachnospiraceae bacterium]|nr:hypothetical protein [Lachnospiraceae bacterium]